MGIMKNGKKDGVWVEWHNYGRRLQETYKDGVLDGFVSIFYKNGQKEWRHTYNNGVLEGNYTRWHRNGKRAIDGFFEDGIPVGVWAWRDEEGNIFAYTDREYFLYHFPRMLEKYIGRLKKDLGYQKETSFILIPEVQHNLGGQTQLGFLSMVGQDQH